MIKNTLQIALMGATLACPPLGDAPQTPQAPAPKPPCIVQVIVLEGWDDETPCDVTPPQSIAIILDDAPAHPECDDAGGQVLYDHTIDRFYCINIDY